MNEYGLKFTQLSNFASEIVKDMRSIMRLFVDVLSRVLCKEVRATMLIVDIEILRLMVYV